MNQQTSSNLSTNNLAWRKELLRLCPILPEENPLSWQKKHISWELWLQLRFAEKWSTNLLYCYQQALQGKLSLLLKLAEKQASNWSNLERKQSLFAGKQLLECVSGARGKELYLNWRDQWLQQQEQTWFHAVLATRAAFFHQPLLHLLLAYAWREWRAYSLPSTKGNALVNLQEFDSNTPPTLNIFLQHTLQAYSWQEYLPKKILAFSPKATFPI